MSNPAPDAAAESEAPKSGPSALIMILALVGGLAVGGAGGAFALGPMVADKVVPSAGASAKHAKADAHGEEGDEEAAADEEEGDGEEEEAPAEDHGKGGEAAAAKPVHTIENLVLNPAESGGQRFLLLSIAFELKDAAALEQMKARDAELRDAVLQSVGAKSVEFLADMAQRDSLKSELKTVAGKLFPEKKGVIRRIYFPQFVIQ